MTPHCPGSGGCRGSWRGRAGGRGWARCSGPRPRTRRTAAGSSEAGTEAGTEAAAGTSVVVEAEAVAGRSVEVGAVAAVGRSVEVGVEVWAEVLVEAAGRNSVVAVVVLAVDSEQSAP